MIFSLPEIAAALNLPGDSYPRIPITGWSVDTRTLAPGDLFFALRGPAHDGHEFVREAFAKGAAAAVVERSSVAAGPLIQVPDVLDAMQKLASWARSRWTGEVVAVTGSAGKTTTKEIIARLLETSMTVGKSSGNLNNHIGLPLSLLRLPADAPAAVLEIGMNHPGEIRRLAGIARPEIGVVTNVGHAHVEHFASIDDVALAKRELIEALSFGGVAVLNADDPRVARFREVHAGRSVTFGLSPGADVRAEEVEERGGVRFRVGEARFESPLAGIHNVLNLLAGIAVAGLFGIDPRPPGGSRRWRPARGAGAGSSTAAPPCSMIATTPTRRPSTGCWTFCARSLPGAGWRCSGRCSSWGGCQSLAPRRGSLCGPTRNRRAGGNPRRGQGDDRSAVEAGMSPAAVFFFEEPGKPASF